MAVMAAAWVMARRWAAVCRQLRAVPDRAPRLALVLFALALGLPGLASIPPVDRDEAYFAQAARQMLETGDFVDIRFQQQPRYRKPVLAYWMQAASARLFGGPRYDRIWAYRLPSLLATAAAVWILFEIGLLFLDVRAAMTAAALMAGTLLLQTQAHQARADALLLLSTVACLWPLACAFRMVDLPPRAGTMQAVLPVRFVVLFWVSLAAGFLIKGPVTPVIVLLTAGTLALAVKRIHWLSRLRPRLGLAILALAALPWPIAMLATNGFAFFEQALHGDLLPKLAGGQESHGAPPLSYLVLLPFSIWPATLLLPQALQTGWRRRGERFVQFCLAWCLPGWLLFELMPTKLPHYVLPLLPAVALLAVGSSPDESRRARRQARLGLVAFALIGLALVGAGLLAVSRLGRGPDLATITTGAALLGAIAIAAGQGWRRPGALPAALLASALLASLFIYGVVGPRLERLWVASRTAAVVETLTDTRRCPVAIAGYREPSFVFLLGTATRFVDAAAAAVQLEHEPGGAIVTRSDLDGTFLAAARARGLQPVRRSGIDGIDPVHGRPIEFSIWTAASPGDEGRRRQCGDAAASDHFISVT
jgi:4-amino-4-deoxy-L-arabinose transferase-like glycosyltransferase